MKISLLAHHGDINDPLSLLTPCERGEEVRVIVAGHSHTNAIFNALMKGDIPPDTAAVARKFGIAGLSGDRTSSRYWSTLVDLAVHRTIVLSWRGNQHNTGFMFATTGAFDFFCQSRPNDVVMSQAHIVPEEIVRAHFRPTLDGLIKILGDLRQVSAAKIIVLGTPAPWGEDIDIRPRLVHRPFWMSEAARMNLDLNTVSFTSLSVRVKLWAVLQDLMKESAQTHNATFIPTPPETCSENGALKSRYWSSGADPTHANQEYGCLVIDHIAKTL